MREMATVEERVLRVLYEAPASAHDCARELQRYTDDVGDVDVTRVLHSLKQAEAVELVTRTGNACYRLTPIGSERLAELVEVRESRGIAS